MRKAIWSASTFSLPPSAALYNALQNASPAQSAGDACHHVAKRRRNQISALPGALVECADLECIYAEDCKLTSDGFPEELSDLSLKGLCLHRNLLGPALPLTICAIESLEELYLDGNGLAELPDEIGDLVSLTELGLIGNKLTRLPKTIGNLSSLRKLHAEENKASAGCVSD